MDLRAKRLINTFLFGRPIPSREAHEQSIGRAVGLAVFASDALSSVAYATQEILIVLAAAGTAYFHLSLPIAAAIAGLLAILTISYRQTIFAYPSGGGAYIVAKDNLGEAAAQTAGAALLMDYVLTVAVSVSSGAEQMASVFPSLQGYRMLICLAVILVMMLVNLRGVKESGTAFAFPTYFFVIMSTLTICTGFFRWITGSLQPIAGVEMLHNVVEPLSLFLVLRAFSSGCTALTGVEAISNGITAFKEPKSRNAATTMLWMSLLLGFLFLGITVLAHQIGAYPSESETVISQLGRAAFGRGVLYNALMAGTTLILLMAANTSYADFPRLCALHAGDGFLPRQLTYKSGRLVFSSGITVLSGAAAVLIVLFNARTSSLIPLYAIGVFLSFTLSQLGMVIRWQRLGKNDQAGAHWRVKQLINLAGALASALVMLIFAITKFSTGAWVTVFLIPAMVFVFFRIHAHYQRVVRFLRLPWHHQEARAYPEMRTVILIDDVHYGTLHLIRFAKTLGHPWLALHVNFDPERAAQVQKKWQELIGEGELKILHSPFRFLFEPVTKFIKRERAKTQGGIIHVITGQLVVHGSLPSLLHSKNARGLMSELQKIERVVVTGVPYHLHERGAG